MSVSSPGVIWDGSYFTFDPALADPPIQNSFADTICVSVARGEDAPDYLDPDLGANAIDPIEWCFIVLDDDTLCPEFDFIGPNAVEAGEDFYIWMKIFDDLSGVYDPVDPSDPQGVVLVYDTDGDLDDGYMDMVSLSNTAGDTFKTDDLIPPLNENDDFVFAVYACDNDTDGGFILSLIHI